MMPAPPSPFALVRRAVGRTMLAGALVGAGYGALLLAVIELSTHGWQFSILAAALLGAALYLMYGALFGLVAGLTLGLGLAVKTPEPARARPLGLLLGLVPTALLVLMMTVGDRQLGVREDDLSAVLIFVGLPVLLGLGWMWVEAGRLAHWRRAGPDGTTRTSPTSEP